VAGFVHPDLAAARESEAGNAAPALLGDVLGELDALGAQVPDGGSTSSHMKYSSCPAGPSLGCTAASAEGSLKISHPPPASTCGWPSTSAKKARSASGSLLYRMTWLPLII
jgi:hypothetical protein